MRPLSAIAHMERSPIRRIYEKAILMEDVIFFSLGEPDFTTPDRVIEAAMASLRRGETHYTPNAGLPVLKKAIAENLLSYDGIRYDPDTEISVTSGGMEALPLALFTLIEPGDEVILSDPAYGNYFDQIRIAKGVPVPVPALEENQFNMTPEAIRAAVTDRTRVIMLNTPCNPTGAVAPESLLREIAGIAEEYDLYVIFDEVYKYLYYGEEPFFNIARIPGMKERTVVIDSCSKTYAMTGWRVGWTAGPEAIISNIPKIQENLCSCVPAFVQHGAVCALRECAEDVAKMNAEYKKRRDAIAAGINAIPGLHAVIPEGAFYLFVNIKETGLTSEEFAERLLEEGHVALSPGSAFGPSGEGFVRMSYATSVEKIEEGVRRIAAWMKTLV
ncbi:MAG: pyridoxal phosphate-dependent aminotransferase [Lachnospiraceae bacterium]|nr:pyridoxal phosphate-dependent aminotransferase [Lachnospiraceae bacterium]